MISLSVLNKMILSLLSLCLLGGCQKNTKTTHITDTSQAVDTAEVEYYNSTKAPEWTWREGIKMDAYLLTNDAEHTMESTILNGSDTATISFWIKPATNVPDLPLISVVNDQAEIMKLTNLTAREEGTLQGMALQMKAEGQEQWLISNNEFTLNTHRYNQVVLVFQATQVSVYLNGQPAMNGQIGASINQIEKSWLVVGKDAIAYGDCMEGQFQDFQIRKKALSAAEVEDEFDRFYPEVLLSEITIPNAEDLQENLTLYPEVDSQYEAQWTSSNPTFLKVENNAGVITKPTVEQGDQEVTLTLTTKVKNRSFQRDYLITIRAETPATKLLRDVKALPITLGTLLNAGSSLPTTAENGSQIEWKVISGNLRLEKNVLIKTHPEEERVPVQLEATLMQGELKDTLTMDAVVLDAYAGYILSYFNGDLGKETGKFAYSQDGLHWTDLNQGKSILTSNLGTGRVRDPFIGRDKEGKFVILATEGYDNPSIYVWKSEDLVNFSDHGLHRVAWFDKGLYSTGSRAWAPEMTYDPETGDYVIYYSDAQDPKSGSMFAVTTQDFATFTYPMALFNPGYKVIDGTILRMHGQYWMLYKDEREAAQTIFYTSTQDLSQGFTRRYDDLFIYNRKYIEGPFTLPSLHEPGVYYLYVDNYPNQCFYVASFSQLGETADFQWLAEGEYTLPNEDVRHGSAIPVTQKELDRILQAYN
ncbi:LamG-like jellyroll fold domain-containing protein [Holdemania massiliensis]|uniref:Family 43 glycosylhydrolase n=2 Tax=Holdemania massiliensis TaxID=1468449 RepID=A0A6N7S6H7_9FIRM|nr:family 43 glycosylhydrolase [Holdemania massiliensis]MSA71168.1 family 43 glycosylhydrolase [Holdemania massiliensis]MSA89494.1 family 43 glycosylhydrolase [Holdemania massiliensis]MSB78206.1 family 43 glycosylhydrolase [Holdemania massiliensis]MSC33172.1 family 43 glycosylhydrolase [Holdemania massiliensis]MSC39517.1 family 43 glycosylhydrolase [Holdemania massiliensis]